MSPQILDLPLANFMGKQEKKAGSLSRALSEGLEVPVKQVIAFQDDMKYLKRSRIFKKKLTHLLGMTL